MTRPVSTTLDIIQREALPRLARTDRISMAINIAVNGSVWVESQSCSARQQWLGVRAEYKAKDVKYSITMIEGIYVDTCV